LIQAKRAAPAGARSSPAHPQWPSFRLRHHFEQNLHVRHRLERYRAGRRMDYDLDGPDEIAAAIAAEIGRDVDYRPVETDGAARAAASIAELL
jgi:hypothetical protein